MFDGDASLLDFACDLARSCCWPMIVVIDFDKTLSNAKRDGFDGR